MLWKRAAADAILAFSHIQAHTTRFLYPLQRGCFVTASLPRSCCYIENRASSRTSSSSSSARGGGSSCDNSNNSSSTVNTLTADEQRQGLSWEPTWSITEWLAPYGSSSSSGQDDSSVTTSACSIATTAAAAAAAATSDLTAISGVADSSAVCAKVGFGEGGVDIDDAALESATRLALLPMPVDPVERAALRRNVGQMLSFARAVQRVDTTGVEPLHCLGEEWSMALRPDKNPEAVPRDVLLARAARTAESYFMAPKEVHRHTNDIARRHRKNEPDNDSTTGTSNGDNTTES